MRYSKLNKESQVLTLVIEALFLVQCNERTDRTDMNQRTDRTEIMSDNFDQERREMIQDLEELRDDIDEQLDDVGERLENAGEEAREGLEEAHAEQIGRAHV